MASNETTVAALVSIWALVSPSQSLEFSAQRGFRLQDFNAACPNTGEPCPAKLELISQYTRDITKDTVRSGEAEQDKFKLCVKLQEYAGWAALSGIECSLDGLCQIRHAMDESRTRQATLSTLRTGRSLWRRILNADTE